MTPSINDTISDINEKVQKSLSEVSGSSSTFEINPRVSEIGSMAVIPEESTVTFSHSFMVSRSEDDIIVQNYPTEESICGICFEIDKNDESLLKSCLCNRQLGIVHRSCLEKRLTLTKMNAVNYAVTNMMLRKN